MRSILHDWPDEKCAEILANLKPAMTPKYSKLLINEYVIPDTRAHWISTALDMLMMATFSSRERSEQNWRRILEDVGFRIIKIWCPEPGAESLIEAEVAAEAPEPGTQSLGEADVASEAPNGIAGKSENESLVEASDIVATKLNTECLSESHSTTHVPPVVAIEPGMASTINADISPGPAIVVPEAGFESSTKADLLPEQPKPVAN